MDLLESWLDWNRINPHKNVAQAFIMKRFIGPPQGHFWDTEN